MEKMETRKERVLIDSCPVRIETRQAREEER